MKITILGSGSATPIIDRKPTSLVFENENEIFLVDCGEGTQWQLLQFGIKQSKINHIFISHLHGDHFLGLVGLISTFHSFDRTETLHIYSPVGLKEIITLQFKYQQTRLEFDIIFHEINTDDKIQILETKHTLIYTFPLKHRLPTFGFYFTQRNKDYNLIKNKLPADIKLAYIQLLKKGKDVFDEDGRLIYRSVDYTQAPPRPKSFAFCSDTIFDLDLVKYIQNVDVLYHESTFLDDKQDRAKETFHSTAKQAATIAQMAKANQLVISHFSARYKNIEDFKIEAQSIFENVILAEDGKEIIW